MQSKTEILWDALNAGQFDVAEEIIRAHPEEDLINSTQANGLSVLGKSCLGLKAHPIDFIRFIAGHPQFNLAYRNPRNKDTNIKYIISTGSPEVFKLFETKEDIILLAEGELSYALVNTFLKSSISIYKREFEKDPNSERTKTFARKVDELTYIITKLRDLTYSHALETDNPDFFDKMEKAGDDLSQPLSCGKGPIDLLKRTNVRVGEWVDKRAVRLYVSPVRLSETRYAMDMFKKAEGEKEELTRTYHRKQADLYVAGAKKGEESHTQIRALVK